MRCLPWAFQLYESLGWKEAWPSLRLRRRSAKPGQEEGRREGRGRSSAAMPKYYEEKEGDGRACSGVREDLRTCLVESSCVIQEGKSPKLCLKEGHCRGLLVSFFECKRSMLDNRARFRGRKGY